MPDILSMCVALAVCGGPLALVVWLIYRASQSGARTNPPTYHGYDDEEFWDADSPDESPPDFF